MMLMTVAHAIQQPVEDGGRDHGVTSELLAQAERPRFRCQPRTAGARTRSSPEGHLLRMWESIVPTMTF